ncbi:MAG: succinate dehydrogenase iron-sulfur subunit [Candidatus Hydrogenedentota bacterium]
MKREIIFKILRYNPDNNKKPFYQEYKVEIREGMTVLDALHKIRETDDPTISMRFSCRMGVCGSCAMLINGKPQLACSTQVLEVSKKMIILAPLPNYDIIKDLIPDLSVLFEKHLSMKPYIKRDDIKDKEDPKEEFYQSPEDLVKYLQFAYCIKCGICLAACPTVATDRDYPGPMPLTQAYRYCVDTRDNGYKDRKDVLGDSHGVFRCHYAGECSNACPKGVDPAKAIQFMKRMLVFDYLKLLKTKKTAQCLGKPKDAKRMEGIPAPPEFTIK